LKHILKTTSAVLGSVKFVSDCIGQEAENAAAALKSGEFCCGKRFHSEEEAGDVAFAKQLASLGDIYVNDAFGTARAHASTTLLPILKKKCFGLLLAKEIESLNKVLKTVKTGNSSSWWIKVSSKIVIENILDKVDHMIIGGGMTFTFVKALGGKIGFYL
jgi:phosphoglycerate kinase